MTDMSETFRNRLGVAAQRQTCRICLENGVDTSMVPAYSLVTTWGARFHACQDHANELRLRAVPKEEA